MRHATSATSIEKQLPLPPLSERRRFLPHSTVPFLEQGRRLQGSPSAEFCLTWLSLPLYCHARLSPPGAVNPPHTAVPLACLSPPHSPLPALSPPTCPLHLSGYLSSPFRFLRSAKLLGLIQGELLRHKCNSHPFLMDESLPSRGLPSPRSAGPQCAHTVENPPPAELDPPMQNWTHPCRTGPTHAELDPPMQNWTHPCRTGPTPSVLDPPLQNWTHPCRTGPALTELDPPM